MGVDWSIDSRAEEFARVRVDGRNCESDSSLEYIE